jgi:hypothetical protein
MPSLDSIATELSSAHSAQRASVLLALQQTHGNRYVQRVVAGIQAKLKVGQPGDVYEQEADRVAEQVMRMSEPQVQRQAEEEGLIQTESIADQITPLVQRQVEPEEEEELIQVKTAGDLNPKVTLAISSGIQSLQGGGWPLSGSERSFFEPRFGVDFSNVRIHNDTLAASVARSVNARAFTFGRDVVFGDGEYTSDTSSKTKLLAHELTHVVQQDGGASSSAEADADQQLVSRRPQSLYIQREQARPVRPRPPRHRWIIRRAIDLFSASNLATTERGNLVLQHLNSMYSERGEIIYAELEERTRALAFTGTSGMGRADIQISEEEIIEEENFRDFRRNVIITSLLLVHEALHHVLSSPYISEEVEARRLEILYYSELERPGVRFGAHLYQTGGDIVDPTTVARREHLRNDQLVDSIIRIPTYGHSPDLNAEWVRSRFEAWGGIANRWNHTKARYIQILLEDSSEENTDYLIRILESSTSPADFNTLLRWVGGGDIRRATDRLREAVPGFDALRPAIPP